MTTDTGDVIDDLNFPDMEMNSNFAQPKKRPQHAVCGHVASDLKIPPLNAGKGGWIWPRAGPIRRVSCAFPHPRRQF